MRFLLCVMLVLICSTPVFGDSWRPMVLKAKAVKDDGEGHLVLTLESGMTIAIPYGDWASEWTDAIEEFQKKQQEAVTAQSSTNPSSEAAAAALIRAHCAEEWPDDYRMRKYCEDQQYEGLRNLLARQMTGPFARIREICAQEWPDDFRMRDYCETQQIEAYRALNR